MSIFKAIHRWLTLDRIRTSPNAGEMFRLEVGQRVILKHELWVIVGRQSLVDGARVGVRYHLVVQENDGTPSVNHEAPVIVDHGEWITQLHTATSISIDCYL